MEMKRVNVMAVWAIAGAMALSTLPMYAAQSQSPAEPPTIEGAPQGVHSWTTEQVVTSSVREAWALGGKTEAGFFDIVKTLAELSAQKRGITLPDDKAAGEKAGEWIKKQAKKDPDQLLYVVVDRAVQYSARVTAPK
jgi:hypothetical protein